MNKLILIIVFVYATVGSKAGEISLDSLRSLYFEEWTGKCGAEKLVSYTEGLNAGVSPVYQAYRGAGLATTANCTSWPLSKLSRFREGKSLLEEAVSRAPGNLEVRFLRYTVQRNIPDFLGYDNVDEDRKFIMEKLTLQLRSGKKDDLTNRILNYLITTKDLTEEQYIELEATTAKE